MVDTTRPQGLEVKIARLRVGMKQYELAAKLGIGPPRLSVIESGRCSIPPELAEEIKRVLDEVQSIGANEPK